MADEVAAAPPMMENPAPVAAPVVQPAAPEVPTITGFKVVLADDPSTPASLSDVRTAALCVTGTLLSAGQEPSAITTPALSDWMIQYGASPAVWVCCGPSWYRLGDPLMEYARYFSEIQRKLDLSVRFAIQLQTNPTGALQVVVPSILQPVLPGSGSMATYSVADLQAEAGFIGGQLAGLLPALHLPAGHQAPMLMDLARLAQPLLYLEDEADASEVDTAELEDLLSTGLLAKPPANKLPSRYDLNRARASAALVTADLARGPPPPPTMTFRLEPTMVPDMLMVWDVCMTYGALLALPPIAMEALEAAIMPGPLSVQRPHHSPVPAPPGGVTSVDEQAGKVTKMEGGKAIKLEGGMASGKDFDLRTLLDPHAAASAVILRDVHAALLKAIDNFNIKKNLQVPSMGRLAADDHKSELWQERTWQAILDPKVANFPVPKLAKEAAELIKNREYYVLNPRQRLAILKTLADMALQGETMTEYTRRVDPTLGAGQLTDRGEAQDPESWMRWADAYKPGMLKPLGKDTRHRSYYTLGGQAGCWRLFVCGAEGGSWGWYEGPGMLVLRDWLRSGGGNSTEAPLLKALHTVPMPYKHDAELLPPYPLPLPETQPGAGPASVPWTLEDLQARRPDGYKTLAAPLLKGECHQLTTLSVHAWTIDERLHNCVEALLTEFEFWNKQSAWVPRINRMLTAIKSKTGSEQAGVVKELEQMLSEAGRLLPVWPLQVREVWLQSLLRPDVTAKDVAMHLLALQHFIIDEPFALTRMAFVRQVQQARCQALFPVGGDVLVFLRTGVVMQLDKYAAMAVNYPVEDLAPAKQQLHNLRPVERMRVVATGYRSYPVTNAEAALRALHDKGDDSNMGPTAIKHAINNPNRPSCQWVVLQPLTSDGTPDVSRGEVVLPLHIDGQLPDYLVRVEQYERCMAKKWQPGDRFRMNFGGKGGKGGGTWYKGTIKRFIHSQGHAGDSNYDPWESLVVVWDSDGSVEHRVNPWEIEMDPEEARKREEERRKAAEMQARAKRAAAKSQRSTTVHLDDLEDEDMTDESSEEMSDSDDSYEGKSNRGRKRQPVKKQKTTKAKDTASRGGGAPSARAGPENPQVAAQRQQITQNIAHVSQQQALLVRNLQQLQAVGQHTTTQGQQMLAAVQQLQHMSENLQRQLQQLGPAPGAPRGQQMTPQQQQQAMLAQQQQQRMAAGQMNQQQQLALAQQQQLIRQQQLQQQQQQQGGMTAQQQQQQMQMRQQQMMQQQQLQMQQQQQQQQQQQMYQQNNY